jgi:transcriptional regulator with XRE-family HTH domain
MKPPPGAKKITPSHETRHHLSRGNLSLDLGSLLPPLMLRQGFSYEKLAAFSGLTQKQLYALESGKTVPTIDLLWKIANALGVPFGSLISDTLIAAQRRDILVLRDADKKPISSSNGCFTSRPLFPFDSKRHLEFYELTIAPGHLEKAEAHAAGSLEQLVVVCGDIEIISGKAQPQRLQKGDAIVFESDVPHSYENLATTEALLYLVLSYDNWIETDVGAIGNLPLASRSLSVFK